MIKHAFCFASILFPGFVFSLSAKANPDIHGIYDARSAAMAGTGVSFLNNGAAAYHNPANLDLTDHFAVTLSFSPMVTNFRMPWGGPGSEQDSTTGVVPQFLVSGIYRLSERFTINNLSRGEVRRPQ